MASQPYYVTFPAPDLARSEAFFGALFGWEFEEGGHITNLEPLPGGLDPGPAAGGPTVYIAVEDVAATVGKVRELGGTAEDVQEGPSGWWSACDDGHGTRFSVGRLRPEFTSAYCTAYLCAKDASAALAFYAAAFGAVEKSRWLDEKGVIGHAEFSIGATTFFISDEWPEFGAISPATLGGAGASFVITVAAPDAAWERALAAGATVARPMEDEFDGRRSGWLVDPAGFRWNITSAGPEQTKADLARSMAGSGWTIT